MGKYVSFQPVIVQDHVDGFEAHASAMTNWRSPDGATDRAGVVALGVMDLVLQWPLSDVHLTIEIDGKAARRSRDISGWQPYEWIPVFRWGGSLTRSVATLSNDALRRIEQLWCASVRAPLATLDSLLGPLAQVSSAATATNPYDRIMPLWSGLELMYPRGPKERMTELQRIDAIAGRDPSSAQVEEARASKLIQQLLGYRSSLARDAWLHRPIRTVLQAKPSDAAERVRAVTVVAYAIRCKIVHGQWARTRDDRRLEAGAAERWLWQLMEREIELRLTGNRLDSIRAIGQKRFGG
jgi:hypothetical protein